MAEVETILMQEPGVKQHDSESPPTMGLKAGAFADVGTLILTNRRLIYVCKGGASRAAAWAFGGALAAQAVEKTVSTAELNELANYEGSYAVPLQDVVRVEAGRKMGIHYVRVNNQSVGQKPAHCYVFGAGWSSDEAWVNAINAAVARIRNLQPVASAPAYAPTLIYTSSQPSTSPPPTPLCPFCNGPSTWIPQYQRWYCYRDQRYL